MLFKKIYIPLTLLSIMLIIFSFSIMYSGDDNDPITVSLEYDRVIHHELEIPFTDKNMSDLQSLLRDSLFNKPASETYLLLFISGSDPCGNCLNEISDYLALANNEKFLNTNFRSLLIYHGADEQQAIRYIKTSGISEKIHHSAFANHSDIIDFDYGTLIQRYGTQNLLYLIDLPQKNIFH